MIPETVIVDNVAYLLLINAEDAKAGLLRIWVTFKQKYMFYPVSYKQDEHEIIFTGGEFSKKGYTGQRIVIIRREV